MAPYQQQDAAVPSAPEPIKTDMSMQPSADPSSWLSALEPMAVDEIFTLLGEYLKDPAEEKVNLTVGVYRTEDGKPWVLSAVEAAEKKLEAEKSISRHEYLPIVGDQQFLSLARDTCFGFNKATPEADKERVISVQTISGSGANHVGAVFLAHHLKPKNIWLSDPTWGNHHVIWEFAAPNVTQRLYPYYDATTRSFDFDGMITTLERDACPGDAILLQACAHNPTGLDPTPEQWAKIGQVCAAKQLFPFFDSAYQGFASGSVSADALAIRAFFSAHPTSPFLVAQSFSKNFGLYGQRVGALHFSLGAHDISPPRKAAVFTHLCAILRSEFSMAPAAGAAIVRTVLADPALTALWHADLDKMSSRIKDARKALADELAALGTPGSWAHIVQQTGMFSYIGLSAAQVEAVQRHFHVYMLRSGRASISGLNRGNAKYVARAIDAAVRGEIS